MSDPSITDPFAVMAAAAEHIAAGRADEIELEWWADDTEEGVPGGVERRMTITMRSGSGVLGKHHRPDYANIPATDLPPCDEACAVPDDVSSIVDPPEVAP